MPEAACGRDGPVVMLYDEGALSGDTASRDVVDQMNAIENAVRADGGKTDRLGVSLDIAAFKARLFALAPAITFNLVESLDGSDRLQTVVPLLLEDWGVPFTGNGSAAMLLSNHKIESKRRFAEAGLPVADCIWVDAQGRERFLPESAEGAGAGDWIVKAVESHASLFLDDGSVIRGADAEAVAERVRTASRERGQAFFGERFIDGREFNLSVMENSAGAPVVFPAAEIRFDDLPSEKPRLVGYAAKWEEDSPEYAGTPRSFDLSPADAPLVAELNRLALAVWETMGLAGYARVDFRVDRAGAPFILEANTNPCLTPDAGFAAAAERCGMTFAEMVRRIIGAGRRTDK